MFIGYAIPVLRELLQCILWMWIKTETLSICLHLNGPIDKILDFEETQTLWHINGTLKYKIKRKIKEEINLEELCEGHRQSII